METIKIRMKNHTYMELDCDVGVMYELKERFTFEVPGAKFSPKYKMKIWDGKISLFNMSKRTLPAGLYSSLKSFCEDMEYVLEPQESFYGLPGEQYNITPEELHTYVDTLDAVSGGGPLKMRDYQYAGIFRAIKDMRKTIVSPTGSGKSFLIYSIVRYLLDHAVDTALVIVPTTALVLQLSKDFSDYSTKNGWDAEGSVHQIMSGKEKNAKKPIYISTWQSMMKMPPEYFQKFGAVIIDETHQAQSLELQKLLEKCTEAKWRLGFTGSLSGAKTHEMQIQAMLGPIIKVTETKKLMDEGHLSSINIKCITLDYAKETKAMVSRAKDYQLEVDFIIAHEKRNKFIRNLAISLKGNTLVLYNFVEKHGDVLDVLFREKIGDRPYFYLHGGVDAEDRDDVRPIIESSDNSITLASYGVFSTGVNVKRIHNIILASPTKSLIRLLQSLGRGLRIGDGKDELFLFDISDDLSNSKSKKNFTYKHFIERLKIYSAEQFDYKIITVPIE